MQTTASPRGGLAQPKRLTDSYTQTRAKTKSQRHPLAAKHKGCLLSPGGDLP